MKSDFGIYMTEHKYYSLLKSNLVTIYVSILHSWTDRGLWMASLYIYYGFRYALCRLAIALHSKFLTFVKGESKSNSEWQQHKVKNWPCNPFKLIDRSRPGNVMYVQGEETIRRNLDNDHDTVSTKALTEVINIQMNNGII